MKVAILAGGMGTRLAEETDHRPKPLVEIGGKPILWHVMKYYESYGLNEFIIALGYKKEAIIRYFWTCITTVRISQLEPVMVLLQSTLSTASRIGPCILSTPAR